MIYELGNLLLSSGLVPLCATALCHLDSQHLSLAHKCKVYPNAHCNSSLRKLPCSLSGCGCTAKWHKVSSGAQALVVTVDTMQVLAVLHAQLWSVPTNSLQGNIQTQFWGKKFQGLLGNIGKTAPDWFPYLTLLQETLHPREFPVCIHGTSQGIQRLYVHRMKTPF